MRRSKIAYVRERLRGFEERQAARIERRRREAARKRAKPRNLSRPPLFPLRVRRDGVTIVDDAGIYVARAANRTAARYIVEASRAVSDVR